MNQLIRNVLTPLAIWRDRLLASFPVATEAGDFLMEPSPAPLVSSSLPPTLSNPSWQLVTSDQYLEPEHIRWCEELRLEPRCYRKQWEWTYILEVLRKHEMLQVGKTGLGFGCGLEPLSAIMAKHGCNIIATDLADEAAAKTGWSTSGQFARQLKDLNNEGLCDPKVFTNQVNFRHCNMNEIAEDLREFDFLWSSCALEHLGGIEAGLRFIENAMKCLRPGGIAVHTTEFNLGSNDKTVDRPSICVFRKQDIESLALRLIGNGHKVGMLDFTPGNGEHDLHIDLPPHKGYIHLRLLLKRHLSTSIGIFITC